MDLKLKIKKSFLLSYALHPIVGAQKKILTIGWFHCDLKKYQRFRKCTLVVLETS